MAHQTLTLRRIVEHPRVDNDCFFSFLSDKGDIFFAFKAEKCTPEDTIPQPPVTDEFKTFKCKVHQLVIPPLLRRVPSPLRDKECESTGFANQMIKSENQPQLISIITEFQPIEKHDGSYDYLASREDFQNDDWSFLHHHHVDSKPVKDGGKGTRGRKGNDDGICPVVISCYGVENSIVMTALPYDDFFKLPDRRPPEWMKRMAPESSMKMVLMSLSSDEITYVYHPLTSAADRQQFIQDFSDPGGVIFGMPPCRPVDAMDILLTNAQDDGGVTRSDRDANT